jgi:SAM-dependent methyltransferase
MRRRSAIVPFEWPRRVEDVADCEFYHTIDLPGLGTQPGHWDLRGAVDGYLGHQDFAGKRVIDVGTGSGFLCFEMEKRGGELVAFDFDGGRVDRQHDVIPYHDFEERFQASYDDFFRKLLGGLDRMKNSFWLSHSLLRSRARVLYGDIYDPPGRETFGDVDYVFFGNILLHLQNPLQAIAGFAPLAREKVIITECAINEVDDENPVAYLAIDDADKQNFATWWRFTPGFFRAFLRSLGFHRFDVGFHDQIWAQQQRPVRHFTIVATR